MAKKGDPMNHFFSHTAILLTIFGVALTTYTLRFGGLLLSERIPRSGGFKYFMEALPGTILVSLVAPGILSAGPWGWIAALVTGFTAHKTGNLFLAMGLGMAIVAIQRNFIPWL
jgi:branched chain amino acid efflux pump